MSLQEYKKFINTVRPSCEILPTDTFMVDFISYNIGCFSGTDDKWGSECNNYNHAKIIQLEKMVAYPPYDAKHLKPFMEDELNELVSKYPEYDL